ncbi:MAG: isoprenylcysteine carboxylmethyltransferase family protein [Rhodospirillaceae bacterium]|nr:isoprenylcysteine carboxylmethyltransferase family protein [Rhodospirillaceae bacterium]
MAENPDHARPVLVLHPPVLGVAALLAAWGLHTVFPLPLRLFTGQWVLGAVLAGLGAAPAVMASVQFLRAGTNIPTYFPATALVTGGVYRISRNPIYLGGLVALAGLAIVFANGWLLVTVPVVAVLLDRLVIGPEERHLEARFGEDYRAYRARTRRWL